MLPETAQQDNGLRHYEAGCVRRAGVAGKGWATNRRRDMPTTPVARSAMKR